MPSGIAGTATGQAAPSRISPSAEAYAAGRSISRATLERLGVASGTAFFPGPNSKSQALFFPYLTTPGDWKARSFPEKHFATNKGFKLAFWNLKNVLEANEQTVFITEGEMDACALVEAGVPLGAVLSVPNGAKERPAEEASELRGYDYVREALRAGLSRAKRFVWCGDSDTAGLSLRTDMARLLGAARFHFIEWPATLKDANDVLQCEGGAFLRELVTSGAKAWPVAGLFKLSEIPEQPALQLWLTGMLGWDTMIKLAPRTLSVVTGQPGHGKTTLWEQIRCQVVRRYGLVACIASFETMAKPHLRRQLRTLHGGKREWHLTDDEIKNADKWIEDHYRFLIYPERVPTLAWRTRYR